MLENNKALSDNFSSNNVCNDNFSKNNLVNFDINGLSDCIALFFPSVRNALIERYRAETTAIITGKAQNIILNNNYKINQIPPKIAFPFLEKSSLEHEEEMYELWAKLLVASAIEYNPIQIQYNEILSQISSNEAKLLKEIYYKQKLHKKGDTLDEFNKYFNKYVSNNKIEKINKIFSKIKDYLKKGEVHEHIWSSDFVISDHAYNIKKNKFLDKCYFITGTSGEISYSEEFTMSDVQGLFDKNLLNSIKLLEKMGLVSIIIDVNNKTRYGQSIKGQPILYLILSHFAYDFVDTLERVVNKI